MRHTTPSLDRRSFLAGISAAAGAMLVSRSAAATPQGESLPHGAFRFLVINDLHHVSPECDAFFEDLITQMRTHRDIAFCLIVGDLADTGRPESMAAIKRIFGGLGAPIHAVPGNHDNDIEGDTSVFSQVFPDSLNYHFAHRGWQFIGLDSTDGPGWNDTHVSAETLAFLDSAVPQMDRKAPTAVFTHFPLAEGVRMRPLNAEDVLTRLAPLNLRAAFCGHFHSRTVNAHGAGLLTTNVCCSRVRSNHDGTRPEGYLLCTAHADGRLVQDFIEFEAASKEPETPPAG